MDIFHVSHISYLAYADRLTPDAQMWSGDMAVTSLLELVITCMVPKSIAASIFSDRWISLKEGCVGHRLRRASTVATGLQDIASAPLCHLPGQH